MIDCKIIEAEVHKLKVKVLCKLYKNHFFDKRYKMIVKITEFDNHEFVMKGEYFLVRSAFEKFNEKDAEEAASCAYQRRSNQ